MKLKTKLTLSISLLVLLVVLAVNLVYLAEVVRQQMQEVYDHADIISNIIFNEMRNEFAAAHLTGSAADPAGLQRFFQGLKASPELATLLSSAIGYGSAIRDVALVAPDGSVVVDSNPLLEGQAQPQRRLMSEVLRGGLWGQLKAIFGREQIYAVSLATRVNQQPLATITIGVDTVLLRQGVVGRVQQAALYGALILLLATGLAWGLAELALAPLGAIIAQLDRLPAANWKRPERQRAPLALDRSAPPERSTGTTQARGGEPPGRSPEPVPAGRDEFGVVSSKIQHLGREMEDARQVYTELQENVSHVLEGLEEGLLLFDESGQSVMASAAAPRLLGLPPGELVGRPVEGLFPGESGLERAVRLAVRQKVAMVTRELDRPGGGRPLLARLDLVPGRSGETGALLTLRDAEPVYRLENELEVARRLSAVGRLTRGVAHEVKNPLNAMAIHLD
ncbi:MAG: PAS domain-containing protein, partial [Streptosporangiaceae bacterium]